MTPEKFAANREQQNKAMVYRDLDSALYLLRRLDQAATRFEAELAPHQSTTQSPS